MSNTGCSWCHQAESNVPLISQDIAVIENRKIQVKGGERYATRISGHSVRFSGGLCRGVFLQHS